MTQAGDDAEGRYLRLAFGAAFSLATSRTTDAPRSMKACAVGLEGAATTSGLPPALEKIRV